MLPHNFVLPICKKQYKSSCGWWRLTVKRWSREKNDNHTDRVLLLLLSAAAEAEVFFFDALAPSFFVDEGTLAFFSSSPPKLVMNVTCPESTGDLERLREDEELDLPL